jgi:hypothetical protein
MMLLLLALQDWSLTLPTNTPLQLLLLLLSLRQQPIQRVLLLPMHDQIMVTLLLFYPGVS